MTNLALLHPSSLLGADLIDHLGRRRELWQEARLLTSSSEEAGTLTEIAGAATMVTKLEPGDLDPVDVAFFCGSAEQGRPFLEELSPAATSIVLSPDATRQDGHPVVAGVNLETAHRGERLLSPHPATVLLAQLVYAMRDLAPRRLTATVLQPASVYNRQGLDEVFEQTRAILAFHSNPPREIFPTQMSFNVIPNQFADAHVVELLGTVLRDTTDLAEPPELAVRILQAGIFHGYGANVHVKLDDDPTPEELREALADSPAIDLAPDPEYLGTIDAAARDEVIVGPVERCGPGEYWIWAVMDNLTCGGAVNAVRIFEAVLHQHVH